MTDCRVFMCIKEGSERIFDLCTSKELTTPSRTHWAAGFLGSRDTPVSCSSSWLATSILVSASMRFCRLWRFSSAVSWKEWTCAVVMFRMWTTWKNTSHTPVILQPTGEDWLCVLTETTLAVELVWGLGGFQQQLPTFNSLLLKDSLVHRETCVVRIGFNSPSYSGSAPAPQNTGVSLFLSWLGLLAAQGPSSASAEGALPSASTAFWTTARKLWVQILSSQITWPYMKKEREKCCREDCSTGVRTCSDCWGRAAVWKTWPLRSAPLQPWCLLDLCSSLYWPCGWWHPKEFLFKVQKFTFLKLGIPDDILQFFIWGEPTLEVNTSWLVPLTTALTQRFQPDHCSSFV